MNQESKHMNTRIFTWKPSDWGENHGSFTKLCQSERWLGQQPFTIYFTGLLLERGQKLRFIQSLSRLQPKGAPTPTCLQCRP